MVVRTSRGLLRAPDPSSGVYSHHYLLDVDSGQNNKWKIKELHGEILKTGVLHHKECYVQRL